MSDRGAALLALDFDGVIADAWTECAAVTYLAGGGGPEQMPHPPTLAEAIDGVPEGFLLNFARVRPYCRTLPDFMLAHFSHLPLHSAAEFDDIRATIPADTVTRMAQVGERWRAWWRTSEPDSWLAGHRVDAAVVRAMSRWPGRRWIVSAKDTASITAILHRAGADDAVDHVAGGCLSKIGVLADAAQRTSEVVFVDDSIDNAIAAVSIPGVTPLWATWGYSAPGDAARAAAAGIPAITVPDLERLIHERNAS